MRDVHQKRVRAVCNVECIVASCGVAWIAKESLSPLFQPSEIPILTFQRLVCNVELKIVPQSVFRQL